MFYVVLRWVTRGRDEHAAPRGGHAKPRGGHAAKVLNSYYLMEVKELKSYVAPVIAHVVAAEATYSESLDFG